MHAPAPRFMTPLDPSARSEGRAIARLAQLLGKPFMPWQQLVVQGATEKTPAGLYRYSKVLISTPRQSGKTTLLGPVQLHRIMTRDRIKAFFTAQTGKDGRQRMLDLIELTMESPLAPLFKARYAAGSEGISTGNGSQLRVFAPGPGALHGETPHLVTLDEIWKHDQVRGAELMGAIGPAQATLEGESQVWMISTMGTSASVFMNELVERGRAGEPGLFYAEWSLPDGDDPYDPKVWWFHPALGNTISESYLEAEARDKPFGEFMRAYMNRLTTATDPLMTAEDWAALAGEQERPARSAIAITYEVAPDGDDGSVVASWRDSKGRPCIRVLHSAPGTFWMHDFLVWLYREWKPAVLGADDGGPTRRLTDELRRTLGEEAIATTGGKDFGTACEAFLTYAREGTLIHDGSQTFARGIAGLVLRYAGDVVRFSRVGSTSSIAGITAAAVGLWLHDHREESLGEAVVGVWSGR